MLDEQERVEAKRSDEVGELLLEAVKTEMSGRHQALGIHSAMRMPEDTEIVNELAGLRRHNIFTHQQYLYILSEGRHPL